MVITNYWVGGLKDGLRCSSPLYKDADVLVVGYSRTIEILYHKAHIKTFCAHRGRLGQDQRVRERDFTCAAAQSSAGAYDENEHRSDSRPHRDTEAHGIRACPALPEGRLHEEQH